jgi:hypothetical protein
MPSLGAYPAATQKPTACSSLRVTTAATRRHPIEARRRRDPATSMLGIHRQAVEVPPPAVPADDEAGNDLPGRLADDQRLPIAFQEVAHCLLVVRDAGKNIVETAPEGHH